MFTLIWPIRVETELKMADVKPEVLVPEIACHSCDISTESEYLLDRTKDWDVSIVRRQDK